MRIAMIGDRGGGGVATHINELSKQLETQGHTVTKISPRRLVPPLAVARYLRKLVAGYDIIHVHGDYDVPGLMAGLAAAKAFGGGTVFTTHGTGTRYWRAGKRWGALWRDSARRFDAIVSVSEYVRRRLVQVIGENPPKHYTVYNGVDPSFFSPLKNSAEAKRALGFHGRYVVLYQGRLAPSKGIAYLLQAVPFLRDRIRNLAVVIGGQGELDMELKQDTRRLGVADVVEFKGFVPQDILPLYYGASDVVVVPSVIEAMGIVPLEAMSMKKAVIGAKTGGIPELVVTGRTGLLVPPRDPEAIADAVIELHDRPEVAAELGENGRNMILERFSWEQIARETLKVYSLARSG